MSDVAALQKGRALALSDGVYLERVAERESALEAVLRSLLARLPRLRSRKAQLRNFVAQTNALEPLMQAMADAAVQSALAECGMAMRAQGFTDALLARAFAAVREASLRTLGLRHHDVQLIGGWALLQGMIAEMETGEGKTLVATLAACTAAAAGVCVHVITVNDYLAQRDAGQNGPLYAYFGLQVGIVMQDMTPLQRRAQYAREVVYVSNKEIVFDYLKDRTAGADALAAHYHLRRQYGASRPSDLLLRGLHVAIVDEADSILIDEARTPLILSETLPDELGDELYADALAMAARMVQGEHFELSAHKEICISAKGEQFLQALGTDLGGVWRSSLWRHELIEKALTALCCFQRDQHYIVADGKVHIVDEFSGRVMPDRSWERGLHQMIEAKEQCAITGQRKTIARITYQRFFGRYLLLCGMTGTAAEVRIELRRVYDLDVLRIPTHVPGRRAREANLCWSTAEARWQALTVRVLELGRAGRAVLIGTRSVEASEHLSALFQQRGIAHAVLNARNDREEAGIIAGAGQSGRITIATNMAGRGTDIRLAHEVAQRGGLFVILTEFHESCRIDRQLFGRCARQGETGTVQALVSLEDELFRRHAPLLRAMAVRLSGAQVAPWLLNLLVRYAQMAAENHNAGMRKATLRQDKKLQSLLGFSGAGH